MTASCRLQTLLAAGHFVLSAELTPPRHHNLRPLMAIADKLKTCVDVIQINDNVQAQARLSNLVAAQFIWHAGIEPIVQMTLRHRNHIALQSDLLGLAALGIRNLIVVGGYPCSVGTDPQAKDAQDMRTTEAIAAINNLTQHGYMFNGEKIMLTPDFFVGTVAFTEVQPQNLEASLDNLEAKIEGGVKFVQLQANFDLDSLQRWMAEAVKRKLHHKVYFLAAMYPFKCKQECRVLDFDLSQHTSGTEFAHLVEQDRVVQFGVCAGTIAWEDAKIDLNQEDPETLGTIFSSAIGGTPYIQKVYEQCTNRGTEEISYVQTGENFYNAGMFNYSAALLARKYNLQGHCTSLSTGCTAGLDALGLSFELIQSGEMKVMMAGATEAPLTSLTYATLDVIGSLSVADCEPAKASRPFDAHRGLRGIGTHVERAMEEGATKEEIIAAILLALPIVGITDTNLALDEAVPHIEAYLQKQETSNGAVSRS